ncbi:MAG: hypothetical protein HZB57_00020 [Gammaproteobacteria bacterium]|nr:hypothetical protein [Gammaproteobacteria bacterium]
MSHPFAHPSSELLLASVEKVLFDKPVYQRMDRHIVFVCGGAVGPRKKSARNGFLRYAVHALPQFRVFLAEAATKDLVQFNDPQFVNLAEFENLVADIADCILIFPETPGSIAEVGYFSASVKTVRKILIANDIRRQQESFINLGPIDLINQNSFFKPVIHIRRPPIEEDFRAIRDRLTSRLPTKNAKKLELEKGVSLAVRERFFMVFEIINIFRILTIDSLVYCMCKFFGDQDKKIIGHMLSVLCAARYLDRHGDDSQYFSPSTTAGSFLEFRGSDINKIKVSIVQHYALHHPESASLIKGSGI